MNNKNKITNLEEYNSSKDHKLNNNKKESKDKNNIAEQNKFICHI